MVERLLTTNSEKQEDKQTASILSNLLHLPDIEFWKILKDSCYNNTLPEIAGNIQYHEFWPHWPPDKNHERYVEPDLFISFEKIDIIIEAKRSDKYQQYQEQWESEFSAYKKKYGTKNNVVLIAIGGLNPKNLSPETNKLNIQKCRWRGLLDTLYKYLVIY